MTSSQLVPALLVPLIIWRIYARVRRNIGRQPYRPRRLMGAAIFFCVITALLALAAAYAHAGLGALAGGLLIAVGLGALSLQLTTWENSADGEFYTPNRIIGIAVTLLFIGRFVYRMVVLLGTPPDDGPPPGLWQSPLTFLIFGVTAGYYITYSLGLYIRGRQELDAVAKKQPAV
jgi:hypothetical protein